MIIKNDNIKIKNFLDNKCVNEFINSCLVPASFDCIKEFLANIDEKN
jgi:hypothetical protein